MVVWLKYCRKSSWLIESILVADTWRRLLLDVAVALAVPNKKSSDITLIIEVMVEKKRFGYQFYVVRISASFVVTRSKLKQPKAVVSSSSLRLSSHPPPPTFHMLSRNFVSSLVRPPMNRLRQLLVRGGGGHHYKGYNEPSGHFLGLAVGAASGRRREGGDGWL